MARIGGLLEVLYSNIPTSLIDKIVVLKNDNFLKHGPIVFTTLSDLNGKQIKFHILIVVPLTPANKKFAKLFLRGTLSSELFEFL